MSYLDIDIKGEYHFTTCKSWQLWLHTAKCLEYIHTVTVVTSDIYAQLQARTDSNYNQLSL